MTRRPSVSDYTQSDWASQPREAIHEALRRYGVSESQAREIAAESADKVAANADTVGPKTGGPSAPRTCLASTSDPAGRPTSLNLAMYHV